jgi:hypothetical protein
MFAEKLARESKMDFALMSGPSFDQFKAPQAIVEIKNLFQWAQNSPRGLLLFIDECDSFLEDRSTLSPERVRVLNEFINQTGTESKKVRFNQLNNASTHSQQTSSTRLCLILLCYFKQLVCSILISEFVFCAVHVVL